MNPAQNAYIKIGTAVAWATLVSTVFYLVLTHAPNNQFTSLAQLIAYGLMVLPVLVLRPDLLKTLKLSASQVIIGAIFLLGSIAYAVTTQHLATGAAFYLISFAAITGTVEELVFRGYIYDLSKLLTTKITYIVLLNATLFALFHIPSVVANHESFVMLLIPFVIGVLLTVLRSVAHNVAPAILAHIIIDISSV